MRSAGQGSCSAEPVAFVPPAVEVTADPPCSRSTLSIQSAGQVAIVEPGRRLD